MGFFGTVGEGLKKAGDGLKKAACDYDEYMEKNRTKQMKRMQSDVEFEKLRTAKLEEKEKQNKYQKSPFRW